jgi:hypothetical protein
MDPEEWRSRFVVSEKKSLRKLGDAESPALLMGGDVPSDEPPEPVDDMENERIREL